MSGWQWLLILIVTVAAGALVGILVGYVYMRVRKRTNKAQVNPSAPGESVRSAAAIPAGTTHKAPIAGLLKEVEADLTIATVEWKGKLTAFKTDYLDSNRSTVNDLPAELKAEITEAYTDMHLTNTLVTLSKEEGHSPKDLEESYLRLRGKVAEGLKKVREQL